MENDRSSLGVQYSSTQALVKLVDNADGVTTASQLRQWKKKQQRRQTAIWILKILFVVSLIIVGPVITFLALRPGKKVYSQEVQSAFFALPEVVNLRLISAEDDSFTVTWERPNDLFDFYWIDVVGESSASSTGNEAHHTGSCARGTILHPDQTRVTCSHLDACTTVNFTVRTYKNGPPEHASSGATLQGILIPGKGPHPPKNISVYRLSSRRSRVQWSPPAEELTGLVSYAVKVCDMLASCEAEYYQSGCRDYETTATSLEFDSISNNSYCVVVSTVEVCSGQVISSQQAVAELKAPSAGLPEVVNLRLVSAGEDSFTVTWDRPDSHFDHYWFDVTDDSNSNLDGNETHHVGSCIRGTILHPDQTRVTCSHLDACTMVNFTVRTYKNGPPLLSSSGATLQGILIPGPGPHPPKKITTVGISPTRTRLQWEMPVRASASLTSYAVKVCDMFASCDAEQYLSGCTTYETIETSLEFDSLSNSSYCILVTTVEICGGRVITSLPALAELKAPLSAPPDVTDLLLEGVGEDSFTASWKRPKGTFDYYWVDVQNENGTGYHLLGSCAQGTILHPNQTKVSCNKLEACANVTFRVRTHRNGPPDQTSPGASLPGIFIPGGAPEDFDVDATATSPTTVELSLHLSQVKQCLKAKCYGRILGGSKPIPFPCDDYVGSNKTLRVRNVERKKTYVLHVVLVNSHNEMNATKAVVFRIP